MALMILDRKKYFQIRLILEHHQADENVLCGAATCFVIH